jgi:hypothetical protein
VKRRGKSNSRYAQKRLMARILESISARRKNKLPVIGQIRRYHAVKAAYIRRFYGTAARAATLGYVKPLSHKSLRPCKGVRKNIRRAYFAFKNVRNWNRGGNRAKDFRPKNVAKSRFTVLNCK